MWRELLLLRKRGRLNVGGEKSCLSPGFPVRNNYYGSVGHEAWANPKNFGVQSTAVSHIHTSIILRTTAAGVVVVVTHRYSVLSVEHLKNSVFVSYKNYRRSALLLCRIFITFFCWFLFVVFVVWVCVRYLVGQVVVYIVGGCVGFMPLKLRNNDNKMSLAFSTNYLL